MNKLKFLSLVALTVLSTAVLAAETEGPWTYVGMRSGTCAQTMNNSISYNNLDNSHWGTVTFWNYDSNGIGFVVQGSSQNNSKNAVYSLYSLTKTIPSYSRCQITWQYQVKGQNVKHYSRTTLYEHTNQSTLQGLAVDFTLDLTDGSGSGSRIFTFSNKSFNGIQTSATQTRSYDFNNLTGTGNSNVARYLLMTHVSVANEKMNDLDEWGSFKSVSATETWTYRVIFTFNGNGNTGGSMSNQTIDNTGTLSANAFSRTGYTFSKWTANKDGSGSVLGNKASVTASSSYKGPKTLYAQWTANKYTVTFDRQDGTGGSSSVQATYDAAMPAATMPTRTGYTFQGYYDAQTGGTQYYKADGTSARTWNKANAATLYARWSVNQYTITFDCNGGSAIDAITQDYGTAVTAPADPTREGYTFGGWEPALPETMPAQNMTVVAQWTEIPAPDPEPEGDGKLTGAFTINASGDQIVFSKGNLQYQASTQTWRFAENQYDTIGGENSNISASYSGWIDLFGWGTGNNPINTSTTSEDYSTFYDWGKNIEGGWRTLTKDEWVYLFCGRTDAAHLFGMGSVNGVNGTIVLPDDWAGDKFTDTDNGLEYNEDDYYNNNAGNRYSFHTYTAEQWQTMEEAGAVFLPAAGNRNGTNVINVNSAGFYWSTTSFDESNAYYLYISSYGLNPHYSNGRQNAISVRLVTAAIPNSITINGTPAVGDNSISLTYYFNPANVTRFDMYYAPCLKVKCVTDNTYDEIWLSNTQISSGTETINLNTLGEFKAGKSYVVCFAYRTYKTEDWVDEVFQSFSFPEETPTAIDNANANAKAVKRIANGQLLIIRDGQTYNAQGAVVR